MLTRIPVKWAIIDEDNYDRVSQFNWSIKNVDGYVGRATECGSVTILLHRFILNAPDDKQVDHINNNPLDNRKENLRLCDQTQNNMNARKRIRASSRYKGVTFDRVNNKWRAQISINKKAKNLGRFNTEKEAALEYNRVAFQVYGEFAKLNEIIDA